MHEIPVVILTRSVEDNQTLKRQLESKGIPVMVYPCVQIDLIPFQGHRLPSGKTLNEFSAIAFTSKRGVAGMAQVEQQLKTFSGIFAAVGAITAGDLEKLTGKKPDVIPLIQTGEALGHALATYLTDRVKTVGMRIPDTGLSVLHPTGNLVSPVFHDILRQAGISVETLTVYTHNPPAISNIQIPDQAMVVFASPSAVRNFFTLNPAAPVGMTSVAIGPVTAAALTKFHAEKVIISPDPTPETLLQFIWEHWQQML